MCPRSTSSTARTVRSERLQQSGGAQTHACSRRRRGCEAASPLAGGGSAVFAGRCAHGLACDRSRARIADVQARPRLVGTRATSAPAPGECARCIAGAPFRLRKLSPRTPPETTPRTDPRKQVCVCVCVWRSLLESASCWNHKVNMNMHDLGLYCTWGIPSTRR